MGKAISERLKTSVVSWICDESSIYCHCSAHLLNLLCHDIIIVLGAKVIIKHAGNLSGFFRRAGEENCGLSRKMATMTDVKWNLAYELLDSVAANRHYIEEYSRRKKIAPLISDIILSIEFWYGV